MVAELFEQHPKTTGILWKEYNKEKADGVVHLNLHNKSKGNNGQKGTDPDSLREALREIPLKNHTPQRPRLRRRWESRSRRCAKTSRTSAYARARDSSSHLSLTFEINRGWNGLCAWPDHGQSRLPPHANTGGTNVVQVVYCNLANRSFCCILPTRLVHTSTSTRYGMYDAQEEVQHRHHGRESVILVEDACAACVLLLNQENRESHHQERPHHSRFVPADDDDDDDVLCK